jgi:hypothetical protein
MKPENSTPSDLAIFLPLIKYFNLLFPIIQNAWPFHMVIAWPNIALLCGQSLQHTASIVNAQVSTTGRNGGVNYIRF